jgi:hypothetical protein
MREHTALLPLPRTNVDSKELAACGAAHAGVNRALSKTFSKSRRMLRAVGYTLLVAIAWCGIIAGRVIYIGSEDGARKSDAIIVLGAAVRHGEPSPAFAGRIRHGI